MDDEDVAGLEGSIRGDDDREDADVSAQQDETVVVEPTADEVSR